VSLQVLAEGFSSAGVPVFAADVKGDLSGIAAIGEPKEALQKRAADIGFAGGYRLSASPAIFWDLFGEKGHPIRATVSEMGPLLLSRLLDLNDTQEGVLNVALSWPTKWPCCSSTLKIAALAGRPFGALQEDFGTLRNVTKGPSARFQRQLLVLEQQGGEGFFGEPALGDRPT
jgi:hypothetical protein